MEKINFQNLPNTTTPVSAENLNAIQDNTEDAINESVNNSTQTLMQTDTAKELEITDSANAIASFNKVEGDTYQATRSGKNKLPLPNTAETTSTGRITYSVQDGVLTLNGTSTGSHYISFPTNYFNILTQTYTMSTTVVSGSYTGVVGKQINNSGTNIFDAGTIDATVSKTFTQDYNNSTVAFYIGGNAVFNNYKIKIQLEEGSTATQWEQYGVSPSPDYPSDIRNVGDNINLLNLTGISGTSNGISYSINSKGKLILNGTCSSDRIIIPLTNNLSLNGQYTFSHNINKSVALRNSASSTTNIFNTINKESANVNDTISHIFIFGLSGVSYTNEEFELKIEKGLIATPYTPYNCGSIDFKLQNKNLFDKNNITTGKAVNFNNGNLSTASGYTSSDFIEVKPQTQYYINHYLYSSNSYGYAFYDKNKNYISGNKMNVHTIISPANAYYLRFGVASNTDINTLQLEKGSTETSYVEHQEQNIHFPLAEGQLLHKDDFLADDGIHNLRGTLIFDGTESLTFNDTNVCVLTNIINRNFKTKNDNRINCNRLKAAAKDVEGFNSVSSNSLYFKINGCTTLQQYKDKLAEWASAGVPLTFEDDYVEPVVTPYTTEQAEAYYKLKHFLTYEGYTLIECIDNMKPDIQANYLYNNKVNNYYGNIIYELENRLHQLEIS